MADFEQNPAMRVLRQFGRFVVGIFVVGYTILDQLLLPLFRPLLAWLSAWRIFEAVGALIARLPPYAMLLVLAVPFFAIEPLKFFALYWIALGHIYQGVFLTIFAHALSILTVERLYHAGRLQLMTIGWFARLMGWLGGIRDAAVRIAKATAAWKWAAQTAAGMRAWLGRLLHQLR